MIQSDLGNFFARGENIRLQHDHPFVPPRGADVADRCARCHVDPDPGIPPIAFDQPATLASSLKAEGYSHGTLLDEIAYRTSDMALDSEQMTPGVRLTSEERDALLEYLSGLKVSPTIRR